MKRTSLLISSIALAAIIISQSSCYRLWTCSCAVVSWDSSSGNMNTTYPDPYSEKTDLDTKQNMKEYCDRQKWIIQSNDPNVDEAECKLTPG
ncbi:MAG: hypothetical protein KDC07_05415 [Chitinophagaceae bacterium]|nr:hypothetical protein [Chitinophagaceae bacterium]MCB9045894.1 hypothetical protein [Chitinophagales bacterium]